jgi:hypothetical protein
MRRILVVALASLIAASHASAADLPVRPTAKVEYLFVDLAQNAVCNHGYSCGYDAPATNLGLTKAVNSNSTVTLNENIVRVGVNFKFGH